jgi:mannosylfructose-phosphate synthase
MAGYRFDERIQKEFVLYRNCDHVIATTEQQVDLIAEHYQLPQGSYFHDSAGYRRGPLHAGNAVKVASVAAETRSSRD